MAEEVQFLDGNKEKGCFFYPFVEAGKEYTIRFVFFRNEDVDDEGFVVNYINDDGTTGWFETKVTAGSNSTGEVRFTSKGKINVEKNGDFRFTEKPTFYNEDLLENKWDVAIGLVEGISWDHGAERKTKWREEVVINHENLTKKCNLFDMSIYSHGIDFVCVRPIMYYEYNGKEYRYQWDSFVQDIFYPPKCDSLQIIDIDNNSQVTKIQGTWKFKTEWTNYDYEIYDYVVPMKVKQNKTLTIDTQNLEIKIFEKLNKINGSAFTEEEEKFHMDNPHRVTAISDDRKTMTQEWIDEKCTLSEYIEGWEHEDYTRQHEFKFLEDNDLGSELWVIGFGKESGQNYRFEDLYKNQ